MVILHFPNGARQPRLQLSSYKRPISRLAGFFWCMPRDAQNERIRALAKSGLSAETIATIARRSTRDIQLVLQELGEAAQ